MGDLSRVLPLAPHDQGRGGSVCSAEDCLEDFQEKNELLLASVFSLGHPQWLLSPAWDTWPLDVQPLLCGLHNDHKEVLEQCTPPARDSLHWNPHNQPLPFQDTQAGFSAWQAQDEVKKLVVQLQETTSRLETLRSEVREGARQARGQGKKGEQGTVARLACPGMLLKQWYCLVSGFPEVELKLP